MKTWKVLLCALLLAGCAKESPKPVEKEESVVKEKQTEKREEPVQEEVRALENLDTFCETIIEESSISDMSVSVQLLDSKEEMLIQDKKRQAASLIKIYIAGAVFENMDSIKAYGDISTLIEAMITVSDNNASNQLVNLLGNGNNELGMEVVNEFCKSHGYSSSHMGRMLLAPNDKDDNYTSVKDCAKFLNDVYEKNIAGAQEINVLLLAQQRTNKIPQGIPSGVQVGNKTGELANVENDIAIVYEKGNPYTLCVMSENLNNPGLARNTIVEISKVVYEFVHALK